MIPKITITQKLLDKYPFARFVALSAQDLNNKKTDNKLETEKRKVETYIKSKFEKFEDEIKRKSVFFKNYNKSFPIEYQLKTISKGKKIPTDSLLKDLFFMTELKNCVIMSVQDMSKLKKNLVFDLSPGDEDFIYMDGKKLKTKKDDIVLRQGKEVIISHLYGAGKSTLVDDKTKDALFIIWSDVELSDNNIDDVYKDLDKYLKIISNKNTKIDKFEILEDIDDEEFIVTPWEVKGEVDYNKLIRKFGTTRINDKLLKRIKKHTGELHYFLRRKIFFSHRDFDKILDHHEKGNEFALYTGRGPSGNTHLGHIIPWLFTKWLQDKFGVELYFELTDVEKFLVKDMELKDAIHYSYENILDIIAVGFDPKKTFIFLDSDMSAARFQITNQIAKKINFSTAKAVFGFNNETNIGLIFHPAVQAAPCYLPTYLKKKPVPTLIPAAIDQDPYWRVTRDIAKKVGFPKPCQIHCGFMKGFGKGGKMSASVASSAIYTTDDPKTVRKKIMKYAFSGGGNTVEEHRKYGGNPDVDLSYHILTFLEPDDKKLAKIYNDYKSGKLLSGELKQICVDTINNFLEEHQKKREKAKKNIDKFLLKD